MRPEQPGTHPDAEAIAAFLRTFVRPALGADEAIVALGRRHVAMRANRASVVYAETLVALQTERREPIRVEFRLLELDEADYLRLVGERAAKAIRLRRIPEHESMLAALLKRSQVVLNRRPTLRPGFQSRDSAGETIRFIKDYEIEITSSRAIPTPIVADALDGHTLTAQAARLPTGAIGLTFEFLHGSVQRPIPEVEANLGWNLNLPPIRKPGEVRNRVEESIALLPTERVLYVLSRSGNPGAERRRLLSVRLL